LGFYQQLDNREVVEASKSVFKIYAPIGQIRKLTRAKTENVLSQFPLDDPMKAVYRLQFDACLKTGSADCYFFDKVSWGSGFLTGDGTELWSAFHVFRDALQIGVFIAAQTKGFRRTDLAAARRELRKIVLPFVVADKEGKIVFLGSTATAISTPEENLEVLRSREYESSTWNDFIKIKLNTSLGKGLPVAAGAVTPGSRVFVIGFPFTTSTRQTYQLPDSQGDRLYLTKGHILATEEAVRRVRQNPTNITHLKMMTVAMDADAMAGMSGGPFLNERAEVVSLMVLHAVEGGDADKIRAENYANFGPTIQRVKSLTNAAAAH
jgi:hypothetical protein